jgi:hypothetical protein
MSLMVHSLQRRHTPKTIMVSKRSIMLCDESRRPGAINLVHNHPSKRSNTFVRRYPDDQQIIAMASPRTRRVCGGFAPAVDAFLQRYWPAFDWS